MAPRKSRASGVPAAAAGPPARLGPWELEARIDAGAFSTVYNARFVGSGSDRDIATVKDHEWVLKVSPVAPPTAAKSRGKREADGANLLFQEYNIYRTLRESLGSPNCFPATPGPVSWKYHVGDGWAYLALQRLGISLRSRLDAAGGKVDRATVFNVGAQLLLALQRLHSIGYVYRDVKLENFMIGRGGDASRVYVVDFGAVFKFMQYTGKPKTDGAAPAGTPLYMSRHIQQSGPPSPRDDLESLGYMMLRMLSGSLPWQSCTSDAAILASKQELDSAGLCAAVADMAAQATLQSYFDQVLHLAFDSQVDYGGLVKLLSQACGVKLADDNSLVKAGLKWKPASARSTKGVSNSDDVAGASDEDADSSSDEDQKQTKRGSTRSKGNTSSRTSRATARKSVTSRSSTRTKSERSAEESAVDDEPVPAVSSRRTGPASATKDKTRPKSVAAKPARRIKKAPGRGAENSDPADITIAAVKPALSLVEQAMAKANARTAGSAKQTKPVKAEPNTAKRGHAFVDQKTEYEDPDDEYIIDDPSIGKPNQERERGSAETARPPRRRRGKTECEDLSLEGPSQPKRRRGNVTVLGTHDINAEVPFGASATKPIGMEPMEVSHEEPSSRATRPMTRRSRRLASARAAQTDGTLATSAPPQGRSLTPATLTKVVVLAVLLAVILRPI